MLDIKAKNIRVLSWSLDLKNNEGKSLSEIFDQLQSGSIVKGSVAGTTQKGEVIFQTVYGKFSAKNNINLALGDIVRLKLVHDRKDFNGVIVSVNEKKLSNTENIKLKQFFKLDKIEPAKEKTNQTEGFVNIKNNWNIPKVVRGKVSYLNLSKIDTSTPLFRILRSISELSLPQINISLNTLSETQTTSHPFIITGEIKNNLRNGDQLIKTDFGIIQSKNTNIPIGQKLKLEIAYINDIPVASSIKNSVKEFLFLMSQNWSLLKNLAEIINHPERSINLPSNYSSRSLIGEKNSPISQKKEKTSINEAIKDRERNGELHKLSSELDNLKELILPFFKKETSTEEWQNIFIPFYNGQNVENYEMKVQKLQKGLLKFSLNLNIDNNQIQIEGLIQFEHDLRTPKNFDLTISSQKELKSYVKNYISEIYLYNQNISGIKGKLKITWVY
jgi:hypothetical protein